MQLLQLQKERLNKFNDLLPVGLLAQLEKPSTGIAEVKGSNSVQAWSFFRLSFHTAKVASITVMILFHIMHLSM